MNEIAKSEPKNEIVAYQPNETMRLEVRVENGFDGHSFKIGPSLTKGCGIWYNMHR